MKSAWAILRRYPLTAVLLPVIVGLQVATEVRPGIHAALLPHLALNWPELIRLQFHRVLTSTIIQPTAGIAGPFGLLGAVALPLAEWRAGSRLTLIAFVVGDALSTLPILSGLRLLDALGLKETSRWTDALDCGSSSAFVAVAAFFAMSAPKAWRWPLLGTLAAVLAARVGLVHHLADYQHVLAGAVGVLLWLMSRPRGFAGPAARPNAGCGGTGDVGAGSRSDR